MCGIHAVTRQCFETNWRQGHFFEKQKKNILDILMGSVCTKFQVGFMFRLVMRSAQKESHQRNIRANIGIISAPRGFDRVRNWISRLDFSFIRFEIYQPRLYIQQLQICTISPSLRLLLLRKNCYGLPLSWLRC